MKFFIDTANVEEIKKTAFAVFYYLLSILLLF